MALMVEDWSSDTEYLEIVNDLLESTNVQQLRNFTHHRYTNRLDHSISVSYLSYRLAKRHHLDYASVARAGLLHDFFLMETSEVEALGLGNHQDVHPRLALENALKITDLNDIERDCILKHMFLVSKTSFPSYKESYVITFVDKAVAFLEVSGHLNRRLQNKIIQTIWRLRPAN